jgi:hypothetical protein
MPLFAYSVPVVANCVTQVLLRLLGPVVLMPDAVIFPELKTTGEYSPPLTIILAAAILALEKSTDPDTADKNVEIFAKFESTLTKASNNVSPVPLLGVDVLIFTIEVDPFQNAICQILV